MDEERRELVKDYEQEKHHESAENESGDRRGDHWHNYFRPDAGVPFNDAPVSFGSRERGAAKSADQRVTRARWQTEEPGDHVPNECGEYGAKHRAHGHDLRV